MGSVYDILRNPSGYLNSFTFGVPPSKLRPGFGGLLDEFYKQGSFGLGKAGKDYKKIINKMGRGEDVSSYGQFNTIRQQGAANRREIEEKAGMGGNALIAASGDNPGLASRITESALEGEREREGMATTAALGDLSREAHSGFQSALDSKRQANLGRWGLLAEILRSGQKEDKPGFWSRFGSSLIGAGANLGSAAIGGAFI